MSIMPERGKFFQENVINSVKRGWHNLSFDNTFTCNSGELYPTKCLEIFPGDVIHDKSSSMARLMPLVAPVMGKLNMYSYHFVVRYRDVWTQWDKFITNYDQKRTWQQNVGFTPPVMPYIRIDEVLYGPIYLSTTPATHIFNHVQNVWWLVQMSDNNGRYSILCDNKSDAMALFSNTNYHARRVFAIIPNKDDDFGLDYHYYNPFCSGSLLEFLKCNIDGFFTQLSRRYKQLYSDASSALSGTASNDWSDYTDTFNISGSYFGHVINFTPTDEWMEHHMILAYKQNCDNGMSMDSTWWSDGSIIAVTPLPGVALSTAPFDPNNAGLYDFEITDLSLRAYRFVYDEYFRDENYIEVNSNTDFSRDGNDLDWQNQTWQTIWAYLTLCRKSYEHDLYTTALPSAQRGNPVRFLPDAQVISSDIANSNHALSSSAYALYKDSDSPSRVSRGVASVSPGVNGISQNLVADMSAATIESLRYYNTMQRYLELKARTGGRYYEYMLGQWNHHIEDAKINRPIYLDGARVPVQISEVTQTSSSNVQTGQPLGDLAGRGVAIGEDHRMEFTSPDYGFLLEFCVVVPRTSYGQGINPMFKRFNYMDYPLPSFANLGEEAMPKRELYATCIRALDQATFGYQSRYYQFKYERDQIHGSMLTDLRHWNFARLFADVPYNGKTFLEVDPTYRQFAVTSKNYDHFLVTMWHDIQINRALPELSIPSL